MEVEGSHVIVSVCGGGGESRDCECMWRRREVTSL